MLGGGGNIRIGVPFNRPVAKAFAASLDNFFVKNQNLMWDMNLQPPDHQSIALIITLQRHLWETLEDF